MTEITIREIVGEEMAEIMHWMSHYAYGATPPMPERSPASAAAGAKAGMRHVALFEDGQAMACAASTELLQNIRGETLRMGGIGMVVTHPAARRKGYSRQLMAYLLELLKDEDYPVSCLYPFREGFYERLGYAPFPQSRTYRLDPAFLAPLLRRKLEGQVQMLSFAEGVLDYRALLQQILQQMHGMALRSHFDPSEQHNAPFWLALARVSGELVGGMMYQIRRNADGVMFLHAPQFYYRSTAGRYLLLEWIARHIDQVKYVEIQLPPGELPETWLEDIRPEARSNRLPAMGRVINVARLNRIPVQEGRITLNITDPPCNWNTGCWSFMGEDGQLRVERAEEAECEISIQGLSALVYGTHDPDDFLFHNWGSPSGEASRKLRTMFSPQLPYLHENF